MLQGFDYNVVYRQGQSRQDADLLSRNPNEPVAINEDDCKTSVYSCFVAILDGARTITRRTFRRQTFRRETFDRRTNGHWDLLSPRRMVPRQLAANTFHSETNGCSNGASNISSPSI